MVMKGLEVTKNFFSKSTVLMPSIQFGIGIKDLIQARMMNVDPMPGLKTSIENVKIAFKDTFYKGRDIKVQKLMAHGADASFFDTHPGSRYKEILTQVTRKSGGETLGGKAVHYMKVPENFLEKIAKATELANRLNLYDSAKKAGKSDAIAAFESLGYMDYAKRGSSDTIQLFGKIVPFMSTHLVANALMNSLPDEDEEQASNNYYSLPDYIRTNKVCLDCYKYFGKEVCDDVGLNRWYFIPKPWEIGQLFMSVPEQIVHTLAGEYGLKENWRTIKNMLIDTFSINPFGNPIVKEGLEQYFNQDTYSGMPIIPQRQKKLSTEL